MPTEIVMNEKEIQVRETKILNGIGYPDMMASIHKIIGQPPTFYPSGLSFSSIAKEGEQKEVYVISQSPGIHPFRYRGKMFTNNKDKDLKEQVFNISLPYLHIITSWIRDAKRAEKMFFTKEPLMDINMDIFAPILPNVESSFRICLGSDFVLPNKELPNPFRTKYTLDFYMDADHNDDYDTFYNNRLFDNFEQWQEESMKNPSLWCELKFKQGIYKKFSDILATV